MATPRNLKQRIALDGGKEIEEELKAIGKVGEKAFALLKQSAKEFEGPGKRLSDAVQRLNSALLRMRRAASRVGDGFRNLARRGQRLRASLTRMGRIFGIIAAAASAARAAIVGLAIASARAADQVGKQAEGLGLTVEAYGRLAFAAEQAGVATEDFGRLVNRINQIIAQSSSEVAKGAAAVGSFGKFAGDARSRIRDAGRETSLMADASGRATEQTLNIVEAVKRLGLQLTDENGKLRETADVILDLADAFQRLPDGIEKSTLAVTLFPELGRRALPFLNQGADAIREQGDQAARLGLLYTDVETRTGQVLTDNVNLLKLLVLGGQALKGLKQEIGLLFAPGAIDLVNRLTDALIANREAIAAFFTLQVGRFITLFDDLIAAFQFRDADVSNKFILEARDAIVAFGKDVQAAFQNVILPTFRALKGVLDFIADAINSVFGTDFTGRQLLIAAAIAQFLGVFSSLAGAVLLVALAFKSFALLLPLIAAAGPVIAAVFRVAGVFAQAFLAAILALSGWPLLVVAGLVAAGALVVIFWDEITAAAEVAFNFIVDLWGDLGDLLGGFADDAASAIVSAFRSAVDIVAGFVRRLRDLIRSAARAAAAAAGFSAGGTGGGSGFSGGGPVRGPGTTTSDSIPAWLSVKEFVMQAKAVRFWGGDFMRAVNAMRPPAGPGLARGGLAGAARLGFSPGALVDGIGRSLRSVAPVPAFAHGGPVGPVGPVATSPAESAFTLVLGGERFPVRADQDVGEALGRLALLEDRSRIGRPPRRGL